jgi:hypothetical protein
VSDRAGLVAFQRFIRELWAAAEPAAARGESLEELQRTAAITADAGYEPMGVPFVFKLDRNSAIQRAWQEATGAVKPAQ